MVDAVWKFFSSVHLAIILLLIIATTSIIGTVLHQGDSAADNIQLFEGFLTRTFDTLGIVDADDPASVAAQSERLRLGAERLYRLSVRLGFTDLYHTWYFFVLLGLFSFNLTVCTVRRWPHTWKMMARNEVAIDPRRFRTMPARSSLEFGHSLSDAAGRVRSSLKKAGYSPKCVEKEGALYFFGQRGAYSRLGVYCTHLSIIVILLGGIIGVTAGYKGYMQVVEGTTENRFYDRRSKTTKMFDFGVRCDDFQIEYYEGTRRPKDFFSDLTIVKDGVDIKNKRIEVNSPITYDPTNSRMAEWPVIGWAITKIYFYQSSYGETGEGAKATLRITDPQTGESMVEKLDTSPKDLPGLGVTVQVLQVLPDFALDDEQRPYSRSNRPDNPAALVEVKGADGTPRRAWVLQRYQNAPTTGDLPVSVSFVDYGGIQYTGLQVVYDPGVWVIWLGCTLMVIGIYLAFFSSHRRVWVRVEESDGRVSAMLAGSANKNRDGFAEDFQRLGAMISVEGD